MSAAVGRVSLAPAPARERIVQNRGAPARGDQAGHRHLISGAFSICPAEAVFLTKDQGIVPRHFLVKLDVPSQATVPVLAIVPRHFLVKPDVPSQATGLVLAIAPAQETDPILEIDPIWVTGPTSATGPTSGTDPTSATTRTSILAVATE